MMPEQHAPTGPVLVDTCPPSPISTSAGKALEEEVSGVPCPGTELYKFQSVSVVSYELRFTNPRALIVSCCTAEGCEPQRGGMTCPTVDPSSLLALKSLLQSVFAVFPTLLPLGALPCHMAPLLIRFPLPGVPSPFPVS